jgi:hypothetical protein
MEKVFPVECFPLVAGKNQFQILGKAELQSWMVPAQKLKFISSTLKIAAKNRRPRA